MHIKYGGGVAYMIYLKEMQGSEKALIKKLYIDSFPSEERKPFSMMLRLRRKKKANLWVIHDKISDKAVGLAFVLLWKNKVLFDYFAIMPEYQSKGYGSEVLKELKKCYNGKCIFGEVEPVDETAENNAQRIRRMDFYLRNGFKETGIYVSLFGCVLQLMYMGDEAITYSEYIEFLQYIFGIRGKSIVKKNVGLVSQTPQNYEEKN